MSERPEFKPGQLISDRYCFNSIAGRGSVGDVYHCTDLKEDRNVALKLCLLTSSNLRKMGMSYDELRLRYKREQKLHSNISHPHIVPVYDSGDYCGHPFLVMDFIDGETLESKVQTHKKNISLFDIFTWGSQISSALLYVHNKDIVHRDVKPSNILIDNKGKSYLADFGIAKSSHDDSDITKNFDPESLMGTMLYISPEYAISRCEEPSIDQYSLGVTLLNVLSAGEVHANTPPGYGHLYNLVKRKIDYPPPSSFRSDFSKTDDEAIMRMLRYEAIERYPNTQVLRDVLQSLANKYHPSTLFSEHPLQMD